MTYVILCGRAMNREAAEETVAEMSETTPLLGTVVAPHSPISNQIDAEVS
jgi:hypothetical protein